MNQNLMNYTKVSSLISFTCRCCCYNFCCLL